MTNTEAKLWLKNKVIGDLLDHALTDIFGNEAHLKTEYRARFEGLLQFPEKQEGDEIWFFDNGAWQCMAGRRGYALVRNGEVITHRVTAFN